MARLDIERQKELEPKRIQKALKELNELIPVDSEGNKVHEITCEDKKITFLFNIITALSHVIFKKRYKR